MSTAAERVREFIRIIPIGRPHVGDGVIADVSGLGSLTVADLRKLCIMAEAFADQNPSYAAAVEHGGCTKECFHGRA